MADDARILITLPAHPKTKKLKRRLGTEGCWSLVCLFLWAVGNRWDGNLNSLSDEDIELAAEWEGERGKFVASILEVGFIDGESGSYVIHDWEEHNPYAASKGKRIAKARAAASKRWAQDEDATSMPEACREHASSMPQHDSSNAHHTTPPHHTKESKASDDPALKCSEKQWNIEPVREVFDYYLTETGRTLNTYTFTPSRQRIGLSRFGECLKKTRGDPGKAQALMKLCVDAMVASDFHMGREAKSNGKKYIEWEKNLFKSQEQMEAWWHKVPT